jgi:wobble nucleotide-excising tRNase
MSPVAEKDPAVTEILESVNGVIAKHNFETQNFQDAINQARLKLEETLVAESLPEFKSQDAAITSITTEIASAQSKIDSIKSEISEIEKQIIEHRRPADELNYDLEKYLGRAELKFEVKDAGYILTRQGVLASGLSEGEKTAIAFLYFLKSLSDKNFDRSTGIVVIDDPISSLDSNSLYCAFGFMKERVKDVGQLFVLTHNFAFFRQVKNWFHHLPKAQRPAGFYMISSEFSNGSRRSVIQLLDRLLHEYDSEYHYLFKIVHSYAGNTTPEANLEAYYHLPNIARRLLETFISFKHPKKASGGFHGMFQEIVFDEAKKSRIVRFLHTHSHDGQIDGLEHDNSILSETPQVLADVLTMIETIDKQHYDELISLMPANSGQDSE